MSNIGRVVEMTNLDSEDFTHAYGGAPFTVKAGETITFPYDVGVHLARHLARKLLIRGDKGSTVWNANDPTNNGGNGTPIWNQQTEETMIKKILGQSYEVEAEKEKTEIEQLKEQIARLNEFRQTFDDAEEDGEADVALMNRKELFAEAKKLGLKFGVSDKNADIRKAIIAAKQAATPEIEA